MKAIITTSANPFHYGHLDLYNKAKDIFGEVKVIVAQNSDKEENDEIKFHLNTYNIPFDIIKGKTVADYCNENGIKYIVRGIRNGVDAEYELRLDFANKEINSEIQTLFIPTSDVYSNISSSTIRELLKYQKYDIVKKYMNEDAMWRYVYGKKYTVYFGKSGVGKSTFLHKIYDDNKKIVNIDSYLWEISELVYGKERTEDLKNISKKTFYSFKETDISYKILGDICLKYLTKEFWDIFFERLTGLVLDWAAFPFYFSYIPKDYICRMELIELVTDEENRKERLKSKNIFDMDIVNTRDVFYDMNKLPYKDIVVKI